MSQFDNLFRDFHSVYMSREDTLHIHG
jgi:hypothetical protein